MVVPLIISTLIGLGVLFLGKFMAKRFNLSACSYLSLAIISFVGALAFHTEVQNKLLSFFSAYQHVDRSIILWLTGCLCGIFILLIFFMEFRRNQPLGQLITTFKKLKYYKYCPDCGSGINAKSPEIYCQCGTKYLERCPECNKKIIRDTSTFCSFCGHNFPTNYLPVD